jgi:hypothetical protein
MKWRLGRNLTLCACLALAMSLVDAAPTVEASVRVRSVHEAGIAVPAAPLITSMGPEGLGILVEWAPASAGVTVTSYRLRAAPVITASVPGSLPGRGMRIGFLLRGRRCVFKRGRGRPAGNPLGHNVESYFPSLAPWLRRAGAECCNVPRGVSLPGCRLHVLAIRTILRPAGYVDRHKVDASQSTPASRCRHQPAGIPKCSRMCLGLILRDDRRIFRRQGAWADDGGNRP